MPVQAVVVVGRAAGAAAKTGAQATGRAAAATGRLGVRAAQKVAGSAARAGTRGAQKAAGSVAERGARGAVRSGRGPAGRGPGDLRRNYDRARRATDGRGDRDDDRSAPSTHRPAAPRGGTGGEAAAPPDLDAQTTRVARGATQPAAAAARAHGRVARRATRLGPPGRRARQRRRERRPRTGRRLMALLVVAGLGMVVFGLPLMTAMAIEDPADAYQMASDEEFSEEEVADGGGTGIPVPGGTPGGPMGSTERYTERAITPTMQRLLDALVPTFGRGHGIGCFRNGSDGEHPKGRACDFIMARPLNRMPTPEYLAHGWAMANWLVANADELDVYYVIWQHKIWSSRRADEGWRPYTRYPNGNLQQNHYDHIHVSVL